MDLRYVSGAVITILSFLFAGRIFLGVSRFKGARYDLSLPQAVTWAMGALIFFFCMRFLPWLVPRGFALLDHYILGRGVCLPASIALSAFFILLFRQARAQKRMLLSKAAVNGILGVAALILHDLICVIRLLPESTLRSPFSVSDYLGKYEPILSTFLLFITQILWMWFFVNASKALEGQNEAKLTQACQWAAAGTAVGAAGAGIVYLAAYAQFSLPLWWGIIHDVLYFFSLATFFFFLLSFRRAKLWD